ncbi:ribosome maturation factor RimM [Sutterella sp.]|uniref:ribosome maturation factor RimM n=1 Tax=Sutterella sp. TaxID=1981025 RepID=UPI0026DEC7AB|nr:ribosome maturation factor RimM [Sutterella sp.]MDO5531936.1 ribosome maturation factor RimM [Sutterella sp.]
MTETANDELIELGRTTGAYGFKGWVRVEPIDSGEVLEHVRDWVLIDLAGTRTPVHVKGLRRHGTGFIAKWDGCESKEVAEKIRVKVFVARADFPEAGDDAVWAVDVIGCRAVNREGADLGEIVAIGSNGAQDLFDIAWKNAEGKTEHFFIPNVKDVYVLELDTEHKRAVFDWDPEWR